MKRTLLSLLLISLLSTFAYAATSAFFSDTEASSDNIFTAGRLDLKINGDDNPTGIVSLGDLKPGDDRIVPKILFSDFNPANVFLHLKDLVASQGAQTDPEEEEEVLLGEPKFDIHNYITYDLKVGDTTIISSTSGILLPDAVSCWIPLGQIPGATDVTVEQSFHFDSTVTDWAQGDMLTFTEEFLSQQINDPTIPVTGTGRVWDDELKKCVDTSLSCIEDFADSATEANQGTRKNGTAVLTDRSDPTDALGAPQSTGAAFDSPVVAGSFYSLGFKIGNPDGGSIVLGFASPFFNTTGADLQIYEVTGGPTYPDEKIRVEVGPTSAGPWTIVSPSLTKDGTVDIDPIPSAQFVRITDISDISLFEDVADAYDLDAVKALCGQ